MRAYNNSEINFSLLFFCSMDTALILSFAHESLYLILVLAGFLAIAIFRGKQALINIILGLYFALLLSLEFPYYDSLTATADPKTESFIMLFVFAIFTVISTLVFNHLMPREFQEKSFEGFGKKLLFATSGTLLVMVFSFHTLPVTEFLTPGTPIQHLFAPTEYFFWWLLTPLVSLYLL